MWEEREQKTEGGRLRMNEKENSSDGMEEIGGGVFNCRYDRYFTLIDADDYLFEFLGYTREEFSELFHDHILDTVYEGDRKIVMEEIHRQLKNSKVFMYENRLVQKGGTICWAWISAELIEDKEQGDSSLSVRSGMRSCSPRCRILFLSWTVSPMKYITPLILRKNSGIRFHQMVSRIPCLPQILCMRRIRQDFGADFRPF